MALPSEVPDTARLATMQADLRLFFIGNGIGTAAAMIAVNSIMQTGDSFGQILAQYNEYIETLPKG